MNGKVFENREILLTLALSNFPSESIYEHLSFYWNVTLEVLEKLLERQGLPQP